MAVLPSPSARRTFAGQFLQAARRRGIPLLESDSVIFLYEGTARNVHLVGDMNGWHRTADPLQRIADTDLWYCMRVFEPDARVDYKFLVNGWKWITDPENPRHCHGGKGTNSELAMPGYAAPTEIHYSPSIPHGRVETIHFPSRRTQTVYPIHIYLPPDYFSSRKRYPTAYFQDGADYLSYGRAAQVLDGAIAAGRIAPVIGVFVCPSDRAAEYAYAWREMYRRFFVRGLVPFIDQTFRTRPASRHRLVVGDSLGANISATIAWHHPRTFANCGLQSPAFWPNHWETQRLLLRRPRRSIRFFVVWGTYEMQDTSLQKRMEELLAALPANGYDLKILSRHEGHSWSLWRDTLTPLLAHFFPPR
jgi:enterochelin esterase-like enzyme